MKLHLPTALRRALLVLIALLSPAVVTTTFATATLAAIAAPALAADLTIAGVYSISGDETYENVTVTASASASDLYSKTKYANFTAGTVTVGENARIIVGSSKFSDSQSFNFNAEKLIVAEGSSIEFLEKSYVYATNTLYTLLNGVSEKGMKVQNTRLFGAGSDNLTSSFLASKIGRYAALATECNITLTSGNLKIDSSLETDEVRFKVTLGDESTADNKGTATATIADGVDLASDATKNLLYSFTVHEDGFLDIGTSNNALTIKDSRINGRMESDRNIVFYRTKFTDLSGDTESSKADVTVNGTITFSNSLINIGGKMTATAGVIINADCDITLSEYATLNLGGKISNSGKLELFGTINLDSSKFTSQNTNSYDDPTYNGYKVTTLTYEDVVITDTSASTTTSETTTKWQVDGQEVTGASLFGSNLIREETAYSTYRVSSGDVNLSTAQANDNTTTIQLNGGTLVVNEGVSSHVASITTEGGASSAITIDNKLSKGKLTATADKTVSLSGSGTYLIDDADLSLGTGVSMSNTWGGTVETTGATTVVGTVDTTSWKNTELGGAITVNSGVTLTLGGNTKLKGQIVNSGTLVLSGKIDVLGSMTHTSKATFATTGVAGDLGSESGSGFATTLDVYTVVDGNAATGTATWTVGGQAAHYDSGKVSLMTGKDTTTWWMNSSAAYSTISGNFVTDSTTTLALNTEGGTLQLDTAPGVKIVNKKTTTVEIADTVTLNANQLDASAADVTLTGSGSYTMADGTNTLGAGVSVGSGWRGTVNTIGDTSELALDKLGVSGSNVVLGSNNHTLAARDQEVAADLNSTGSMSLSGNKLTLSGENTLGSLNADSLAITGGSTTITNGLTTGGESSVATGATLSIGGNSTLGGKISNSGTLVLGGNIDVLGSMTHTSKATFATTGDASDLGTESGSGFASSLDVYSVVEGNSATGSATWTVDDQAAHYDSGKVSLLTGKDTSTWWMNAAAAYSSISGNFVTGSTTTLALNTEGGTLQLDTDPGVTLVSKKASTVEIGYGVTLNAAQLNASAADVTLSGSGSYTMENGANTLGSGVSVGAGWSGVVNTTGDTTALELNKLGVSGSKVVLGNASHTLAARDQEVAADLNSTGSMSLSGNKLTLSGENTLGCLNAGSLAITGGSTTITNGLTTGGESSVATGATLSIGGNSTLGGKISNSGTLVLGGNITIDSSTFAAGDVLTINPHYQQGSKAESMTSGFLSVDGMKIKVVTGSAADATNANWSVSDVTNGSYTFDAASGELHVVSNGSVGTAFYINTGDAINYGKTDAAFTNINGQHATELVLYGGNLVLSTELLNSTMKITANTAGSVEIGNNVNLYASQLDASAAHVTLSGSGSYTLKDGANTLGERVNVGTGWTGTVKVSGGASALNISSLGVSGSSIELGAGDYAMAAGNHTVNAKVNGEQSRLTMDGGNLTLNATAKLQGVHGASSITATDATISSGLTTDSISGTVIVTGGKVQEMTADSAISTSGSVSLSNVTLGAVLNNSGTLSFSGQMMLDTALLGATPNNENWYATSNAAGEYGYTNGSGFRTIREIYTVVTGTAADNTASWKADNRDAEYADGKVLAFQEKDLTTYWVNTNSEVILGTADDAFTSDTTTIALNGGKLVMDTHTELAMQSHATSTIEIGNAVTLNAAQLNTSAADVTLSGSGSYTLESGANALNTGVGLSDTGWRGTVNTTGNTTALELDELGVSGSKVELGNASHTLADRDQEVAASLNSTGSVSLEGKKLSLSGSNTLGSLSVGTLKIAGGSTAISGGLTTTGESSVADGANLSIGGVSSIGGKITLGSGSSLVLAGTITLDTTTFKPGDAVEEVTGYFIGDATKPNSTQSGFKAACWDITIAEGGSITDNGVTWQLAGDAAADFDFVETDGTLHAYGSSVESVFHVAQSDTITYDSNNAAVFVNRKDTEATAISLNGGTLVLNTDLRNTADDYVKSTAASTIEIGNDVTLKARQLDASAADVTLRGNGSYTLEDGANTLGEGVNVGTGWTGTVNTTGDTSALELDTLGVSGSVVELGSDAHTLEARDQSVAANLSSTGSVSLEGKKLTLSGSNTLGSLNVGSLAITGGSTTITNGLTIGGESSVTTGATLSLSGNSTLGGKITNSGTLELGGNITVNKDTFNPGDAVKNVISYFIGSNTTPNSTNSGFEAACWDITIAEGGTITDKGATWKLVGDENATFDFAADGTLHAYGSGVGTVFHVAGGDTISYSESNVADFVNSKGEAVSAIQLNGGTLKLGAALDTTVKSAAASSVVIADGVNLDASQLDASAAAVTLSGKGSYTLGASANALNTGVGLGSDWSGTLKLTGAADALELSSLGNALSSIDLGSFNHTLADGEHVIDSALMGSGSLTLNKGSKLTLNGDCSNWSGDIIGQVELELTEGGTIGGNVQVDSLHIGESSTIFEGNLTTTGTITVSENATLSMNGNTTLGGTIESADSGKVELAGQITVDVENFKSSTEVKDVTGYFIGNATTPNSTNSGFEAACWDITIAEGGTITDKGATWKLVGDENATFDFAADGTLHAYGSDVGTVFHVAEGDTITYSESNAADFVNSKGEAVSAIQLNGGTLELGAALATTVKSAATSSVVIADGVTLNASQLDASAADVTLRGEGSYTMQGQELSGVVELNTGVELDTNEWKGTVYTGSTAQGATLDITALGNSQSNVYLGAQPMRRSMPGETVLESLIAAGVGTTEVPGSLTLQKGTSTADALVVNGILTLGSADAAAGLVADSVSLQGLSFAHADSSLVAGSLEGATTLNVQLTDEVLSNKDAGETLTLVTLEEGFEGTLTFNGSTETERVRSEDNRKEYTLAWNEAGTALTLTILGTETYVAEQVKPTTHNGKAGVALMTDVFLNSRPQKDAPEGALAGILNAVDAGTATDRDMAAVAGASTAALGMALSGDVERQLRAIRNRSLAGNDASTTTLVDEKSGMMSAEAPARFFAWVNAEGNRAEQNDDSTAAGYTLTSWGGTVGAGVQVNDKLTLGLALTAMYGDLQSDGPDYLKGDMDTAYLSAFARYNRGKWSHAFIGTAGTMEADYKRTAMSYSTDGDTDGTAFGLMYEVSREFKLGNLSTLSPVLNIAYRHTAVDSYSESGADAALNVGEQSMDTVTLGAGARYAAVVGQQTLNRACGFEARALVKYDLGDRQITTSTGFTGYATRASIESAELGAFGVELGAGISVPVGTGSIFADGAVELRSDYTNFNAAVGYRVQF